MSDLHANSTFGILPENQEFIIRNFDTEPHVNPWVVWGVSELLELSVAATFAALEHNAFHGSKYGSAKAAFLGFAVFAAIENSPPVKSAFTSAAETFGEAAMQWPDEEGEIVY